MFKFILIAFSMCSIVGCTGEVADSGTVQQ